MLCQAAAGRALQDTVRLRLGTVLDSEPAATADQALNRHSWSLPSATASLLICTIKEILRDKHMQLRITAFLLLLVSPSESNYDQVYKSPLLVTRLLSYPGTGRYSHDRKFCLQDCWGVAFFPTHFSRRQLDRHKNIHSKGSLLTPAQRKCLTKLFEVFLYSSPGILLDYRLDKAPRLFFVLHFCRNPSKQNAIMEEAAGQQ